MKKVAESIPAYTFGTPDVATSPATLNDLQSLKTSIDFTEQDEYYLHIAGEVLTGQTEQIVAHWRGGIIAGMANLARHSRTPENEPNPQYLAASNLRFEQWILDTASGLMITSTPCISRGQNPSSSDCLVAWPYIDLAPIKKRMVTPGKFHHDDIS